MKSVKYLEALQKKLGNPTQEALAKELGITQGAVGHYLNKRRVMDRETCGKVALALNLSEHEAMQLVAAASADQAEQAGEKSAWEVFMNRGAAIAASVLMATSVNLFLTPAPANAATMRDTGCHKANNIDYTKFGRRRRKGSNTVRTWLKRMLEPAALEPTAT